MNENNDNSADDLLTSFDEDADIFRLIRTMLREHSSLSIEFQGEDKAYASIITACDPKHRTFTIDHLQPPDGDRLLNQGRDFSIIGLCNGVPAILNGSRISSFTDTQSGEDINTSTGFLLKFPNTITYQQRRQFFRTQVPRILNAGTHFSFSSNSTEEPEIITGRLIDLSNTGFACEFPFDERVRLEKNSTIESFTLHIENLLELNCAVKIMNARKVNKSSIVRCGMAFVGLSSQKEKLINRIVLQIQQKLRQTETRRPK